VVRCRLENEALRLDLELGSRAVTADPDALRDFVMRGANPSEASEVWLGRPEDDRGTGAEPPGPPRPPVRYAEPAEDEQAWRQTIDRLAPDDDYAGAVFLRIASVRPAEDASAQPMEAPHRLHADRPYLVHVASYNPHLTAEQLRDARLVTLYDELATAVVVQPGDGIPADGVVDVLISPIVGGPGWLELNVSLGVALIPAASLGWVAETPPPVPPDESAMGQLPLALSPSDPVAESAVRAYAVVAESSVLEPHARLRLLDELRAIAPHEPRLAEAEADARYELGDHVAAREILAGVPLDELGVRGRAILVAATLRAGHLPEPLERVRVADLSRPEAFGLVLDATVALPPDEVVRLSEFVVGRLLSEDRAGEWLGALTKRPLPDEHVRRLRALSVRPEHEEGEA
jgi:hypothetical protein